MRKISLNEEKWTQQLPSASHARSGSTPITSTGTGSDQGPAGFGRDEEVREPGSDVGHRCGDHPEPSVVMADRRRVDPSKDQLVALKFELGCSIEHVSDLRPFTRSCERNNGTPGNHVKDDVTRKYSSPMRQMLGSG